MSREVVEVVITGDDAEWMARFVRSLVDDRVIACGNVSSPIRSIYRWRNNVEDQAEVRATLHTRASQVPTIVDRANREHAYEVPCVIALPILAGNPEYLQWILTETDETEAAKPA